MTISAVCQVLRTFTHFVNLSVCFKSKVSVPKNYVLYSTILMLVFPLYRGNFLFTNYEELCEILCRGTETFPLTH